MTFAISLNSCELLLRFFSSIWFAFPARNIVAIPALLDVVASKRRAALSGDPAEKAAATTRPLKSSCKSPGYSGRESTFWKSSISKSRTRTLWLKAKLQAKQVADETAKTIYRKGTFWLHSR